MVGQSEDNNGPEIYLNLVCGYFNIGKEFYDTRKWLRVNDSRNTEVLQQL